MALYYYSKDRPEEERNASHNTLFQARPGEALPEPQAAPAKRPLKERAKSGVKAVTPPILLDAARKRRARGR